MVGATIVLGVGWASQFAWTVWREYHWRGIVEVKAAQIGVLNRAWVSSGALLEKEKEVSDSWKARYDTLVEKLRTQAAKPDDGIIHVRNSGDVRRVFEQEVARSMAAAEKAQEN